MGDKVLAFIKEQCPITPCVVVDVDTIANNYAKLRQYLPFADVFYAVKANPGEPVVDRLNTLGCSFDVASVQELDLVLKYGASPSNISYGNTIKKERDIKYAYDKGVRLFVVDSMPELEKISRVAPGAKVFCRILWLGEGAEWPLSRKFGCDTEMAVEILVKARDLGLVPYGVSFHPGSQQKDVNQWTMAIECVGGIFNEVEQAGIQLHMVNLGGGFPIRYRTQIPMLEEYADVINTALRDNFKTMPRVIIEPGRSLVGDAGVVLSEVVLISRKTNNVDEPRWVFLDIGKFSGLAETMEEAIQYNITTERDGGDLGRVIIAGPTCDSADILYQQAAYYLPMDLQIGDIVTIENCSAYSISYASIGFNGFEPPKAYFI